jgi:hypothetical protein
MAILFDWYEDPKPSDKQQGENENTLHPRIKYNGSTGTDVLRRRIQERCSLTETDVSAVLDFRTSWDKNWRRDAKYIWTASAIFILA